MRVYMNTYGGEEHIKPSIESFKIAIDDTNIDEVLMIGDNIDIDIKGAIKAGIKPLLIDRYDRYKDTNYCRIKEIKDLKEML